MNMAAGRYIGTDMLHSLQHTDTTGPYTEKAYNIYDNWFLTSTVGKLRRVIFIILYHSPTLQNNFGEYWSYMRCIHKPMHHKVYYIHHIEVGP